MDRLAEIVEKKRRRVATSKKFVSLEALEVMARQAREHAQQHALTSALKQTNRTNVIAEFKRRSPSRGDIRSNADPSEIASKYERGGAAAISVLTEEDYFDGSLDDLRAVRQTTPLPILRKDFIFEDYQVYESAAAGADAILLIVAALDDATLGRLRELAEEELSIDALVEVHTADEMSRAVGCGARMIGVNNRNLSSFEVSLETSIELAMKAPADASLISESGIATAEDMNRLLHLGYHGFLIGEALMRADNPEAALSEFTQSRVRVIADSAGEW